MQVFNNKKQVQAMAIKLNYINLNETYKKFIMGKISKFANYYQGISNHKTFNNVSPPVTK